MRRVLALALAIAAGCSSGADKPPAAAPPRLKDRPVYVEPVVDDTGALWAEERDALRAAIVEGLKALARQDEKARRPVLKIVETPDEKTQRLALRIERLDPDGSPALALLAGFGAGRPVWEIRLRLSSAEEMLGDRSFERRSSRYMAAKDGPRQAILRDIAAEAVAFVRRRR